MFPLRTKHQHNICEKKIRNVLTVLKYQESPPTHNTFNLPSLKKGGQRCFSALAVCGGIPPSLGGGTVIKTRNLRRTLKNFKTHRRLAMLYVYICTCLHLYTCLHPYMLTFLGSLTVTLICGGSWADLLFRLSFCKGFELFMFFLWFCDVLQ